MKVYLLEARLGTRWLTCYRFNRMDTAQEQLTRMNTIVNTELRSKNEARNRR